MSYKSPSFAVGADGGKVSFRNLYTLEDGFDGMVALEISINGVARTPTSSLQAAKHVAGGYNDIISSSDGGGISPDVRHGPVFPAVGPVRLTSLRSSQNCLHPRKPNAISQSQMACGDRCIGHAVGSGVRIDNIG